MSADRVSAVRTSMDNGVLTVCLNRPERRNALDPAAVRDICAALDEADARDEVRAVVFTGAGRAYSVGADLSGGEKTFTSRTTGRRDRDWGGVLALRLFGCTKPVVAAVNGDAVGLGATMLLPMDLRLAATTARFGFVFTRRGIVPEACSSWFLPRVVGIATALRWTMSGEVFGVEEAYRAGLIHRISEPDDLLAEAHSAALSLVAHAAPVSVAATRQMMWRGLTMAHPMEAHRMESALIRARGASADAREGITAFLQRREPDFPGRPSRDLEPLRAWWADPPFDPRNAGNGPHDDPGDIVQVSSAPR